MTRREPLPSPFDHGAFRVSDARAAGVHRSRLRAKDLATPAGGIRAHPAVSTTAEPDETSHKKTTEPTATDRLVTRLQPLHPAIRDEQFVSHETALTMVGSPLPIGRRDPDIHVSAYRPHAKPRRSEFVGHRLQTREPRLWTRRGVRFEHPVRAWRQTGTLWSLDDLIASGDHLVNPRNGLVSLDELREEVDAMGDVRGGKLASALEEIRIGSESPEETRLRLALVRGGGCPSRRSIGPCSALRGR